MNINDSSSCDEVNELRASANMRTSVRLNQLPEVNKKNMAVKEVTWVL